MCGYGALVRVESRAGSPTIVLVAREFLGKAKEDFTFKRQADREAFYETLLHFLGPGWTCKRVSRSHWLLSLLILGVLFGLLNICCGGIVLLVPPSQEPKPGVEPMPEFVKWGIVAFGIIVTSLCVFGFLWLRKLGARTWETICKQ